MERSVTMGGVGHEICVWSVEGVNEELAWFTRFHSHEAVLSLGLIPCERELAKLSAHSQNVVKMNILQSGAQSRDLGRGGELETERRNLSGHTDDEDEDSRQGERDRHHDV